MDLQAARFFEDALELIKLMIQEEYNRSNSKEDFYERIMDRLDYYLTLVKEKKFERLRWELGALKWFVCLFCVFLIVGYLSYSLFFTNLSIKYLIYDAISPNIHHDKLILTKLILLNRERKFAPIHHIICEKFRG